MLAGKTISFSPAFELISKRKHLTFFCQVAGEKMGCYFARCRKRQNNDTGRGGEYRLQGIAVNGAALHDQTHICRVTEHFQILQGVSVNDAEVGI